MKTGTLTDPKIHPICLLGFGLRTGDRSSTAATDFESCASGKPYSNAGCVKCDEEAPELAWLLAMAPIWAPSQASESASAPAVRLMGRRWFYRAHVERWGDPEFRSLSDTAVRVCLGLEAALVRCSDDDENEELRDRTGGPMPAESIADACAVSPRKFLSALEQLKARGWVEQDADGLIRLPGFVESQLTPSALRSRKHRAKKSAKADAVTAAEGGGQAPRHCARPGCGKGWPDHHAGDACEGFVEAEEESVEDAQDG